MNRFEYKISKHDEQELEKVVYFCSTSGECTLDDVTETGTEALKRIFNSQGEQGWELVQFSAGSEGLIAFWKRLIKQD